MVRNLVGISYLRPSCAGFFVILYLYLPEAHETQNDEKWADSAELVKCTSIWIQREPVRS